MPKRLRDMYVNATAWNFTEEPSGVLRSVREHNAEEFDRLFAEAIDRERRKVARFLESEADSTEHGYTAAMLNNLARHILRGAHKND